jgi:O-antigen/teichoic acid export membrane protein
MNPGGRTPFRARLDELIDRIVGPEAGHTARSLFRGMAGALSVRMFNNVLMFGAALILARLLGAEGYGAYSFGLAAMQLVLVLVLFGSRALITREVAQATAHDEGPRLTGVMRFGVVLSLLLSLTLFAGLWFARPRLDAWLEPKLALSLSIALLGTPAAALMQLHGDALRAIGRITTGLWGEFVVQPASFVLLVVLAALWAVPVRLTLEAVLWFNVCSWVAAALFVIAQWRRLRPGWSRGAAPSVEARAWLLLGLNMLFINFAVQLLTRVDRVMLGALGDAASVGVYTLAVRITEAAEQFIFAMQTALAPAIARAYAAGEIGRLKRLIRTASLLTFLLTLVVIVTMMVFARPLFGLFGDDFDPAASTFYIVGTTKIAVAFAGPAMLLLSMTRHAGVASAGVGIAALANIALNALFIPLWGANGAAFATLICTIGWNAYLSLMAYLLVGVNANALGPLGHRPVPPPPPRP